MNKASFNRILEAVCEKDSYFIQKPDCVGRMGLSSQQKIVCALRMLAYGGCGDLQDEYLKIVETTAIETIKRFCRAIVKVFSPEYCRTPTVEDIARMQPENERRGFPVMVGSIDCMHWEWNNCPHAWKGQYQGHCHAATIILEAVASYDTWIWHSFFGMPGACNDLNVLAKSHVFEELLEGNRTPMHFEVNGNTYDTW